MKNPKLTAYLMVNTLSLRSGVRQGCLPSPLLFNIVLKITARTIWQENEIKGIHIERMKKQNYLCLEMT